LPLKKGGNFRIDIWKGKSSFTREQIERRVEMIPLTERLNAL